MADSFDAMSSNRPYRKRLSPMQIDEIFHKGRGIQWDPKVVDALFACRMDLEAIRQKGLGESLIGAVNLTLGRGMSRPIGLAGLRLARRGGSLYNRDYRTRTRPPRYSSMKSPFPGMDPYLEDQGRWQDFHAGLITYSAMCSESASARRLCRTDGEEVRVVTWQEGRAATMRPDVAIVRGDRFGEHGGRRRAMVATLETVATFEPVEIPSPQPIDEVRDTWIEIRRLPDERLITAIEILSPTNKGSSGLDDYLRQAAAALESAGQPGRDRPLDRRPTDAHGQALAPGRLLRHRLRASRARGRRRLRLVHPQTLARDPDPPGRARSRHLRRPRPRSSPSPTSAAATGASSTTAGPWTCPSVPTTRNGPRKSPGASDHLASLDFPARPTGRAAESAFPGRSRPGARILILDRTRPHGPPASIVHLVGL